MSGASEAASSRRLRRASPRKERFWLSFDRRILYSIAAVVLIAGALVFGAGVGVGRALAPLVPEGQPKRAAIVAAPVRSDPIRVDPPPVQKSVAVDQPEPEPAMEPTPAAPRLELRPAPADGYGLQLGAFESEADAGKFLAAHADALTGLPLHLVPTKIPKKGTWYRVRVGAYADKSAAEAAKGQLDPALAQSAIVVSYR